MQRILISFLLSFLCCGCGGGGSGGASLNSPVPSGSQNPPAAVSSIHVQPWNSNEIIVFVSVPADPAVYGLKIQRQENSIPADSSSGTTVYNQTAVSGTLIFRDQGVTTGKNYHYRAFTYNSGGTPNLIQPSAAGSAMYFTPTSQWMTFYHSSHLCSTKKGDILTAFDPAGVLCGRLEVSQSTDDGNFGYLNCYFDDSSSPADEGGIISEKVFIYHNGILKNTSPGATFEVAGSPGAIREITLY